MPAGEVAGLFVFFIVRSPGGVEVSEQDPVYLNLYSMASAWSRKVFIIAFSSVFF